jgi:ADP-heptose:LPS heptosyltransferase
LSSPSHLLVFRFSSLGDVAMTVPVIRLLLRQHPQLEVTVVSTEFMRPFFEGEGRLHFFAADLKGRHRGIGGLFRLSRELARLNTFTGLADLHNVLRTKLLRIFLRAVRFPQMTIDKGRREKRELTRPVNKQLRPLPSTFQRYAEVFRRLGYSVELDVEQGRRAKPAAVRGAGPRGARVGIAPFAQFDEKVYPPEKMQEVIRLLCQQEYIQIFLFGGKEDRETLQSWAAGHPALINMAGRVSFREELDLIATLDLMVSMDSANMHLASLYGVPVVSIWGGTHPWLGFYGWGQDPADAVQVELDCRPSSVFGNKPCPRGDKACMHRISPLSVYDRIMHHLNQLPVSL